MTSESAARGAGGAPGDQTIERARELVAEALEIVDALKLPPEIGAKLQEALSALEEGPAD